MVDVSIVKSTSYDTSESVDEDDTTSEVKKVLTNEELPFEMLSWTEPIIYQETIICKYA